MISNILMGLAISTPNPANRSRVFLCRTKIKLMGEKLNFLLGIKAENFSLINDKFYLSPMAKVSYLPNENVTLWGGFTQSFTTAGFNLTNIDLYLFETPPYETWAAVATQAIYGQVYQTAYQTAIDMGAPDAAATAAATSAADNYVASKDGQSTIAATASNLMTQTPNVALETVTPLLPNFKPWNLASEPTWPKSGR